MLSQEECVSPAREPRKPSKTRGQSQVSKREETVGGVVGTRSREHRRGRSLLFGLRQKPRERSLLLGLFIYLS